MPDFGANGLKGRKEVAELMDENVADAFYDYIQSNYVSTIMSVVRDCVNDSVKFAPRVSPEVGNNQELCSASKAIAKF